MPESGWMSVSKIFSRIIRGPFFSNLIEQGLVTVNGDIRKDSYKVSEGDQLSVRFPEPKRWKPSPRIFL